MTRSFSTNLRLQVIEAVTGGMSTAEAATQAGVARSTAAAWLKRYRTTGEIAARKQGNQRGSKLDAHETFILELLEMQPDLTLAEIVTALARERGVSTSPTTVWCFFERRGIRLKKGRTRR